MHILNVTTTKDKDVVQVRVLNSCNERAVVHIPITDGVRRQGTDYTIYQSEGPFIIKEISEDFFDDPVKDIEKITKAVNVFLKLSEEERDIDPFIEKKA